MKKHKHNKAIRIAVREMILHATDSVPAEKNLPSTVPETRTGRPVHYSVPVLKRMSTVGYGVWDNGAVVSARRG
jgi:hypothetical protein